MKGSNAHEKNVRDNRVHAHRAGRLRSPDTLHIARPNRRRKQNRPLGTILESTSGVPDRPPTMSESEDEVCPDCGGTGEVTTMEPVYPDAGSPMAPIGTATCHCRKREPEYEPE